MKVKPDDIQIDLVLLRELQKQIVDRAKIEDIMVEVKKVGDKFVIPMGLAAALVSNNLGVLKNLTDSEGKLKTTGGKSGPSLYATKALPGPAGVDLVIGTDTDGSIIEVLLLQATFLCDATVLDRTAELYIPELGLGGVAGASPTTMFLADIEQTLSASQWGYIIWIKGDSSVWAIDNGTLTRMTAKMPERLFMRTGGDIIAKYSANGQVADNSGLDILYQVLAE